MKISKRVLWLGAVCAGLWNSPVMATIQREKLEVGPDTLGIASEADSNSEVLALPDLEEIGLTPAVPEDLLRERFAKLEKSIPLTYHKSSHEFVEYFIYKKTKFTISMMEKMPLYFPLFEKTLQKHGLPTELKYLSMIESGLNPTALSRVRAGGLWQFMPATGREFGLYQDSYIDERFEPVKATEAACRYLKQLYRIFGDWELALASYNTGPGNVKRAMRRSRGTTFWTIYNVLPKETRSYVPQYVAMNYMMNYGNDHGVYAQNMEYQIPNDTIHINGYINLTNFCLQSGIDFEELTKLNPQLTKTMLPDQTRDFVLKVPSVKYTYLVSNRNSIMDSCTRRFLPSGLVLAKLDSSKTDSLRNGAFPYAYVDEDRAAEGLAQTGTTRIQSKKSSHTVRSGETLQSISRKYDVRVAELKKWNKIRRNYLQRGERLVIIKNVKVTVKPALVASRQTVKEPVANDTLDKVTLAEVSEETEEAGDEVPEVAMVTKIRSKQSTHIVKGGETLESISKKHHVKISELREWNNIRKSTILKGQKLLVYKDVKVTVPAATLASSKVEKGSQIRTGKEESKQARHIKMRYHTVQQGDTLWNISLRYGLPIDDIKKANKIRGNEIKPGMKLIVSS
jgi:membrane-bound lytic murein transglycosylase D